MLDLDGTYTKLLTNCTDWWIFSSRVSSNRPDGSWEIYTRSIGWSSLFRNIGWI